MSVRQALINCVKEAQRYLEESVRLFLHVIVSARPTVSARVGEVDIHFMYNLVPRLEDLLECVSVRYEDIGPDIERRTNPLNPLDRLEAFRA